MLHACDDFSAAVVPRDARDGLAAAGLARQPHLLALVVRADRHRLHAAGGGDGSQHFVVGNADVEVFRLGCEGRRRETRVINGADIVGQESVSEIILRGFVNVCVI